MSHKLRYIILTLVFLGLLILFASSPMLTGLIIHANNNITTNCVNINNYYECVQCCQANANTIYGNKYYGTTQWNSAYTNCWNNYCQRLSDGTIV
jgi:hypothetical protein